MDRSQFADGNATFGIVVFIGENRLKELQSTLESIEALPNVFMVIQPCPEEAVTFLHHISKDLPGEIKGTEVDFYWEGFKLKRQTPSEEVEKILDHHHQHLVAILNQDPSGVRSTKVALLAEISVWSA